LDKRSLPAFLARSLIALDHLIRYNVSEDLIDEWCDFLGSVKAVFISLVGGSGTFVFLDGWSIFIYLDGWSIFVYLDCWIVFIRLWTVLQTSLVDTIELALAALGGLSDKFYCECRIFF
jgi:hypothetical protein